jgi:hypothetical protein
MLRTLCGSYLMLCAPVTGVGLWWTGLSVSESDEGNAAVEAPQLPVEHRAMAGGQVPWTPPARANK